MSCPGIFLYPTWPANTQAAAYLMGAQAATFALQDRIARGARIWNTHMMAWVVLLMPLLINLRGARIWHTSMPIWICFTTCNMCSCTSCTPPSYPRSTRRILVPPVPSCPSCPRTLVSWNGKHSACYLNSLTVWQTYAYDDLNAIVDGSLWI